ncbi:MAG: hypothetical protein O9972_34400, partial [Burkholderiales bacterium]|nr:hypothetical protein [Burkholderiales bacterium]
RVWVARRVGGAARRARLAGAARTNGHAGTEERRRIGRITRRLRSTLASKRCHRRPAAAGGFRRGPRRRDRRPHFGATALGRHGRTRGRPGPLGRRGTARHRSERHAGYR